jgi:hypothetical protein
MMDFSVKAEGFRAEVERGVNRILEAGGSPRVLYINPVTAREMCIGTPAAFRVAGCLIEVVQDFEHYPGGITITDGSEIWAAVARFMRALCLCGGSGVVPVFVGPYGGPDHLPCPACGEE